MSIYQFLYFNFEIITINIKINFIFPYLLCTNTSTIFIVSHDNMCHHMIVKSLLLPVVKKIYNKLMADLPLNLVQLLVR